MTEKEEESLCKSCTRKNDCPSPINHVKDGNIVLACASYNEDQWHKLLKDVKPPEGDWQHPTDMHY